MKLKKLALAFITTAAMAASLCPLGAFAEAGGEEESDFTFRLVTKPYQIDKWTVGDISPEDAKAWIVEHREEILDSDPEGYEDYHDFFFVHDGGIYMLDYYYSNFYFDDFDPNYLDTGSDPSGLRAPGSYYYIFNWFNDGEYVFVWTDELESRTDLDKDSDDIDKGIIISPDEAVFTAGTSGDLKYDSETEYDFYDDGNNVYTLYQGEVWDGVKALYYNGNGDLVCYNIYGDSVYPSVLHIEDGMNFKVRYDAEEDLWHIEKVPALTAVEAVDPTCEEGGNTAYWFYTEDVGEQEMVYHYFGDKNGNNEIEEGSWELDDLGGHDWGEPEYEWAEDGSYCTATVVCNRDNGHILSERAVAKSEVKTPATETEKGTTIYTANFINDVFEDQTLELQDIPMLTPEPEDSSTPDSSTPDSSGPDSSTPDSSEPESAAPAPGSNPGTGAAAGLGILAAVAAAAIAAKKRK
ncbi:MAG: hypothetical protein IKO44_03530 [Ruminococcus sp.]|nr:hypothetical protein [Ruminococcus sp.]